MSAIILKIQIFFFSIFPHFLGNQTLPKKKKKCHFKLKIFLKFRKQRSSKQIEILLNQKQKEKNEHILINYFILKLPKYKINNNKKFKPRNGVWDIMWKLSGQKIPQLKLLSFTISELGSKPIETPFVTSNQAIFYRTREREGASIKSNNYLLVIQ